VFSLISPRGSSQALRMQVSSSGCSRMAVTRSRRSLWRGRRKSPRTSQILPVSVQIGDQSEHPTAGKNRHASRGAGRSTDRACGSSATHPPAFRSRSLS
jgi:hypothetical protein